MKVRTKTWLPTAIGLAAFSMGGAALAQCCAPPPPPVDCCTPPPAPPAPPEPPSACCRPPPAPDYPGGGYGGGNFNLNVNVNANGNANYNSNSNTSLIRARASGSGYSSGGGGGGGAYFNVDQPYPTVIQGMNVESGAAAQVVQVAVNRSRWTSSRVVIQAVCIDDRNIPHPASQVQPGREVADSYEGELYRCIAGSRLQVTYADYLNDTVNFDRGLTISCAKGESLWYRRRQAGQYQQTQYSGQSESYSAEQYNQMYAQAYSEMYAQQGGMNGAVTVRTEGGGGAYGSEISGGGMAVGGGEMICATEKQERDCNERSLLRRYGAGVKILTLWHEEYYTEYEEQVVQAASAMSVSTSLSLDGGVGGRVF